MSRSARLPALLSSAIPLLPGCAKEVADTLCESDPSAEACVDTRVFPAELTPDEADATLALAGVVGIVTLADGRVAVATDDGVLVFAVQSLLQGGGSAQAEAGVADVGQVASGGDLDGDGLGELLVQDGDSVRVYAGSALSGSLGPQDAWVTLSGAEGREIRAAAGGGDTTGDGVDDLVVSELNVPDSGRWNEEVRIVSGADLQGGSHGLDGFPSSYGAVVDGTGPASLVLLGDADGDGLADLASGATRNFAAVHPAAEHGSGPWGGLSAQEVHLHDCHPDGCDDGVVVQRVGDTDGDGLDDLLLWGTPQADAFVISSAALSIDYYATQAFGGKLAEARSIGGAASLWPVGDVDGNGLDDLVAVDQDGTGWLVPGNRLVGDIVDLPTSLDELDDSEAAATNMLSGFGDAPVVGAPGDLDGNGLADLLLSDGATLSVFLAVAPSDG